MTPATVIFDSHKLAKALGASPFSRTVHVKDYRTRREWLEITLDNDQEIIVPAWAVIVIIPD